eukprot:361120-Chlamydomonas_euryale.AAC.1
MPSSVLQPPSSLHRQDPAEPHAVIPSEREPQGASTDKTLRGYMLGRERPGPLPRPSPGPHTQSPNTNVSPAPSLPSPPCLHTPHLKGLRVAGGSSGANNSSSSACSDASPRGLGPARGGRIVPPPPPPPSVAACGLGAAGVRPTACRGGWW